MSNLVNLQKEISPPRGVICPVCASSLVDAAIPNALDHITKENFKILSCRSCSLSFTYPAPDDMEKYYPRQYRGYSALTKIMLQLLYRVRVKYWVKAFAKPGKALEIGCGTGVMLVELKKRGWAVTGIERTESVAAYARDNFGLNVLSCGLEALPKEERFDLVILFNALEHMKDPLTVLRECSARLRPNGQLLISVPNFDSYQARFESKWLHLDVPRHLFHFTPVSMVNILGRAGLKKQSVKFVSFEHDPFGWIQSSINKITGSRTILTRYLMGLEKFSFSVAISFFLGFLLVIPAVFLSLFSWVNKKGAIMHVVAVLSANRGSSDDLVKGGMR